MIHRILGLHHYLYFIFLLQTANESVSSGVWAPQALAFTAGTEAKPECPAVNRPARTQCAAWDRVHFMEFACALFLVMYLHGIAVCDHVHNHNRV